MRINDLQTLRKQGKGLCLALACAAHVLAAQPSLPIRACINLGRLSFHQEGATSQEPVASQPFHTLACLCVEPEVTLGQIKAFLIEEIKKKKADAAWCYIALEGPKKRYALVLEREEGGWSRASTGRLKPEGVRAFPGTAPEDAGRQVGALDELKGLQAGWAMSWRAYTRLKPPGDGAADYQVEEHAFGLWVGLACWVSLMGLVAGYYFFFAPQPAEEQASGEDSPAPAEASSEDNPQDPS